MTPETLLYVKDRTAWRDWLAAHHAEATEVWLVAYRKETGRPSVAYSDAVEEALCFGWIDSTRRGLDAQRYAQRYTPRRPGSAYSQTNKERLARLAKQGLVTEAARADVERNRPEDYEPPADILDALRAYPQAWAFFQSTSPAYQRIRVAYVDTARGRGEEYDKRIRHLVAMCGKQKHIGYGIEAFY